MAGLDACDLHKASNSVDRAHFACSLQIMGVLDCKYLKTESDGEQPNNLLSLPECP